MKRERERAARGTRHSTRNKSSNTYSRSRIVYDGCWLFSRAYYCNVYRVRLGLVARAHYDLLFEVSSALSTYISRLRRKEINDKTNEHSIFPRQERRLEKSLSLGQAHS